jgi:hypothetical protein
MGKCKYDMTSTFLRFSLYLPKSFLKYKFYIHFKKGQRHSLHHCSLTSIDHWGGGRGEGGGVKSKEKQYGGKFKMGPPVTLLYVMKGGKHHSGLFL